MAKTLGILELNDFQMQLSLFETSAHENSSLNQTIDSCGYSTIDASEQSIIFGVQAQQQFRRQPLNSYNQYWNQLNVDPINTNHNKLRHFADFAHQQLLDLHHQANFEQLILIVPASFNREKLSLLLGICGQCPFEVVGLVDSAVLGSVFTINPANHSTVLHLDIQLHQCILTHLASNENNTTQVNNADIIPGTGISQLYVKLAHYLSEQFIEQCRFDPIHNADSEQQLYNLLAQLINGDKSQELSLSLQGKEITLNRQSIWRHASDLFDELISTIEKSAPFDTLLVHQRITTIDSLYNRLSEKFGDKMQIIEQQAISENAKACQKQILISDQGLQYITRLTQPNTNKQSANNSPKVKASHILIGHNAYPLLSQTNGQAIYISNKGISNSANSESLVSISAEQTLNILNNANVTVNGQSINTHQTLNLGDQLQINGQQASLINVLTETQLKG